MPPCPKDNNWFCGKTPWQEWRPRVQEVVSSNPGPAVETIYHAPLNWIKSMKAKIVKKVTWHCCMCCNPKGRVEFEDSWRIKSSFITKDEMTACQLTRIKIQKKRQSLILFHFCTFNVLLCYFPTANTFYQYCVLLSQKSQ